GERGLALPFLGRPAPTPRTFERLQAMTAAAPLLIWSQREANGDHRVHVEPLPADNALAAATARLEALVRATPTAWVWLHDRWRDG
ncbi:MAG: hypothetical protein KC620_03405, partial [Myxococcales bacterium]|nr:hypothetical protein [Myxococcales bacterium]